MACAVSMAYRPERGLVRSDPPAIHSKDRGSLAMKHVCRSSRVTADASRSNGNTARRDVCSRWFESRHVFFGADGVARFACQEWIRRPAKLRTAALLFSHQEISCP